MGKLTEVYIIEKKPATHDYQIKDGALAMTSNIEVLISGLVKDWYDHNEWVYTDGTKMDKSEKMKLVNLAIKNIKLKKIEMG